MSKRTLKRRSRITELNTQFWRWTQPVTHHDVMLGAQRTGNKIKQHFLPAGLRQPLIGRLHGRPAVYSGKLSAFTAARHSSGLWSLGGGRGEGVLDVDARPK